MFRNFFKFISVVFLLAVFTFSQNSFAQTVLINPAGDGGFTSGSTFAANGWTDANSANNPWVVGTAVVGAPFSGNVGYVSNDAGITNAYTNTASSLNYFYRDVTVPAGETKIVLTFNWICNGESTFDLFQVFTAATSITPAGTTTYPGSGTSNVPSGITGATFIGYGNLQTTAQTATFALPSSLAGTTFRLILGWKNDTSGGTNPPAAIDNISLVSSLPVPLVGGNIYPINGTQSPPTSFSNITTALAYMATDGITGSGQVIFELNTGYGAEPGPVSINAIPGTSATLGVTFRPALGYTALTSIPGAASPNQHAIKLNACSYVTLDGRAGGVGTSRNWTVRVTGSGTSGLGQMAVRMDNTSGSMTGNNVRYLIMEGECANTTGAIFQITGSTTNTISNIIIENNEIKSTSTTSTSLRGYGITLAVASNVGNTGIIVRNNEIRDFYARGINLTGGFPGIQIYGNEIYHSATITQPTTIEFSAFYFSTTTSTGAQIYSNYIHDIQLANGLTGINGIYFFNGNTTGTPIAVFNNRIQIGQGITVATLPIYGIYENAVSTALINFYYNSVLVNGSATSGAVNSVAFRKAVGTLLNVKDNIFYNARTNSGGTGTHWAIAINNTTLSSINNNDYFADGSGGVLGTTDGTTTGNKTTLALWKAAVPADANSVSQNPNYIAGLKINTAIPTQLESGGTPIAGITTDFEGTVRNATTPDIGADEFDGTPLDLSSPVIVYTPLLNTNSVATRLLNATISDAGSGVPTAGIGLPVLYWRINSGSWNAAQATFLSGTNYQFSFGGGVATGDTVKYFVVAQDLATTPNVGAFPSLGAGGFSANPPFASTPPTTPSSYRISQAALAGNYTVGLTLFNQVTGNNIYFDKVVTKVMKEVDVEVPVDLKPVEKGKETRLDATTTSDKPQTIKKLMEVEEISWVPMQNGQPYLGDLYVKKAENPQFNYPDNTDGIYTTITAAVADLNLRGVSGVTTFLLNDATYPTETYPLVINVANEGNFPTATNTVTIKPNTSVTSLVQGTSASSQIFKILNSYVTIDGSNSGGTDRSLTIQNLSATAPQVVVFGSTGTTPITNCSLKNTININGANTSSAVVVSDGTTPGNPGYFSNITLQNNSVQLAYIAIYCNAVIASGNGSGLLLTGNDLTTSGANSIRLVGLYVGGVDGATVSNNSVGNIANTLDAGNITGVWFATGTINSTLSNNTFGPISGTASGPRGIVVTSAVANANVNVTGNTVTGMTTTSTGIAYGIFAFSTTSGVTLEKNRISNIKNTNAGGYSAIGIALGSTLTAANMTVSNNFIWDVAAYGYTSTTTDNGFGINLLSGGGYNLYFNSVGLSTEQTSATGNPACLIINSAITTAASLDIRDNIFATFQTVGAQRYAVLCNAANTVFSNINYNDYYTAGPNLGYIGATNRLDLAAWQTGTGQDLQSISGDPKFVSATDLHINTAFNVVDAKAQYLASVPTDIDGNARNASTPDIGADEYVYVPPTVNDPTGVTAAAISDTQINVAFTPNGSSNNVVIVWNLTGTFTAPVGPPPTTVGDPFAGGSFLANTITSPYNHTGLTGSTTYYYKLFSYDGSIYSPGVATNATTNASPIAPPYVQDFEGTFPPTGWTNYGTKTWFQSTTGGIGGSKCASVSYTPAGTANLQMPNLVLPASPLYRIKFSWKDNDVFAMMNGENSKLNQKGKQNKGVKNPGNGPEIALHDTTYFEISTNGGTTWTVLAFLSAATPQANYTEVIQNLNSYAGQTLSIRWRDVSDGLGAAYGTGLDNITVEEIPACPAPTGLTVAGITNSSANIGWSGATTVDIDYGTPGHPAGTGTVINGVTANPYTLGSLTASTPYDVYVRQNCGGSSSTWAGPLSFTTACDIVLAPWTEDFEHAGAFPPPCWSLAGTATTLWINGLASGYGAGTYSAKANFYGVSSGSRDLISLGYNAGALTNPILKFDWAYATYSGEVDEMDVYYSTNGGTTWTLLLAMPGGTNGILNPYGIVQSASFIPAAGQWSTMSLSLPAGSNMVKFTAISAFGNNLYVDNIKVQEAPAQPVFSLSPTSKNFGSVYVGSSSANQTFTISNTGAGTLTITAGNISIIGTNASQFVLTDANTYPINLTNGQSATVAVKFSPTSAGAKTASLQIVDNTAGSPHTAALTGVGATPPAVPYFTDFETFTAGQQVACQDPINWSTWSNLPCSAEDAFISANHAYSGTKSAVIALNNDLVRPLLSQTTGKWSISFMTYIPTGKVGYFNTLAGFTPNPYNWGMECYFNAGGAGSLSAGSATPTTFTWVPDSWKKVEVRVDLNNDLAEFWYDGTMIKSWQWTLGASGGGSPLRLDANDFFGASANDEMYIDDYRFKLYVPPPAVPYFADFEGFTAGQQVACQDPVNWSTWSNLPCSSEDAFISSNYAFSGTKSVVIAPNNDLIRPLLSQTTGKWSISFMQYIPTGKTGYFNTLAGFTPNPYSWGMECYFNAGGAGSLSAGSATPTTFTWVPNSWKKVEVRVDLDLDLAEFWYGGTMIKSWQWTLGATGTGCPKQLDANDFFGAAATEEMYFDDYSFQPFTNTFQLSVSVANGWNMVSVPGLNSPDQNVGTWWAFKDPTANVFKYAGGYQAVATATPGLGYWMKNSGARVYNTGDEWPAGGIQIVAHAPLAGAAGWNLIGGYENVATTALITTVPGGLQSGPVYKYSGGYLVATTLDPGYGYWIKLTGAGQIIIPETLAKGEKPIEWFPEDWGKIVLTDAAGVSYTLFAVKGEVDLSQYELPPAPMAGMFDIRFSSGRIAEDINSSMQTIDMSGITYPLTVRVDNMDIRLMDETGKNVNVNLKSGEDVVISDATINKLMVSSELIPEKYSLEQNYPNPFNPSTVIEFSLPENVGNVKLSIYNTLGEKVAELVNTTLVAGKYSYQWNAQNVATGMYIYELRTDKFVSVKKMLLLK